MENKTMTIEEKKIAEIKELIILQASEIEKMINNCINGLLNKDKKLLQYTINQQEELINKNENKIDKLYTSYLALYRPEAKALRTILMISKMNIDLERIGDHCVNIAESALYLIDKPLVKPLIDIPRMADEAKKMIRDGIDSFFNEDSNLALNVCKRDELVDELNEQVFRDLITYMLSDPKAIERSLNLIRIAHNIEKIADLATNISEETLYAVTGKNIKHSQKYKNKK
jgi:phosphate transport system protein